MTARKKPSVLTRMWHRLMGREDGNATIEFAILFPVFMMFFMVVFELGLLMTRYMMFDRALDITVREMRLSDNRNFNEQDMKNLLCAQTVILANHCQEDLRLEMVRLDTSDTWNIPDDITCRQVTQTVQPTTEFITGQANDVMFVRACMAMEPFFVRAGLGEFLMRDSGSGKLFMTAKSALSVEPVN